VKLALSVWSGAYASCGGSASDTAVAVNCSEACPLDVPRCTGATYRTAPGCLETLGTLLKGAVPVLATHNLAARGKFDRYIASQVDDTKVATDFHEALKDLDPRARMMDLYISGLTKASFQGSNDIKDRVREALGITNQQLPTKRITDLDVFFTARNNVAHRMDHLTSSGADAKPARQQRKQNEVGQMCDQAFLLMRDLINIAAKNTKTCST
jgi:hypothetical protein